MFNYSNYSNQKQKFKFQNLWSFEHSDFFRLIGSIRIIRLIFTFLFLFFLSPLVFPVNAQCPVCTVAVGGGVVLSRYLGIDDLAVGIWIGGFTLTFGLWTATFVKKTFFKGQQWLVVAILWITTVWSLKLAKFIGNPTCKIHEHDKLLTGIEAGTIAFLLGFGLDGLLRKLNKKNPGKAFFPYQRVVCPVGLLIIATIIGLKVCKII